MVVGPYIGLADKVTTVVILSRSYSITLHRESVP